MINPLPGVNVVASLYAAESARMRGVTAAGTSVPEGANAVTQSGFAATLKDALNNVSQMQNQANELGKQFQLGNPNVSLEEMMIASQKANIAFQTVVQTRNRLVAAYSEIMNMQV